MVRRLRDHRELVAPVAQRGVRRVHDRRSTGSQARAPRERRLLPRRIPAVHGDRRRALDAARRPTARTTSIRRARSSSACSGAGSATSASGRRSISFSRGISSAARSREDVRQAVLDATGENLAQFWAEWMYRPGYPRFSVRAAYDSSTRRLSLHVRQTQGDSAGADSARADSAWPPTPLRVPRAGDGARGHGARRRAAPRMDRCARADDRDRLAPGRADDGGIRRRQHDREGTRLSAAHRMARHRAREGSRPVGSLVGDRCARASHGRQRRRARVGERSNRRRLLSHAPACGDGTRALSRRHRLRRARVGAPR